MEATLRQAEENATTPSAGVRSVRRALALLSSLGRDGRTLTELAGTTDVSLATASRLLNTLRHTGYVAQRPDGRYVAGLALVSLLYSTDRWAGIRGVATQATQTLRDRINETAAFFVLADHESLCIESAESDRLVRRVCLPGERRPFYLGAAGKSLLAFSDAAPEDLGLRTDTFVTADGVRRSRQDLRDEVHDVRARGYATSRHESTTESWSVAAPVRLGSHVVGVLVAVVPDTRNSNDYINEVTAATVEVAAQVSGVDAPLPPGGDAIG